MTKTSQYFSARSSKAENGNSSPSAHSPYLQLVLAGKVNGSTKRNSLPALSSFKRAIKKIHE